MDKVRRNSLMLPMESEAFDVGTIPPLAHAYDYYPLFRGGANGKGIAQFNTVTPVVYRAYRRRIASRSRPTMTCGGFRGIRLRSPLGCRF